MSKPAEFRAEYRVIKPASYGRNAGEASGALDQGRVVWLNGELRAESVHGAVAAYVEPHGIVYVDPQCLTRCAPTVRHL